LSFFETTFELLPVVNIMKNLNLPRRTTKPFL